MFFFLFWFLIRARQFPDTIGAGPNKRVRENAEFGAEIATCENKSGSCLENSRTGQTISEQARTLAESYACRRARMQDQQEVLNRKGWSTGNA